MVLALIGEYQERRSLQAEQTKIEQQISEEEDRTKELEEERKESLRLILDIIGL